MENLQFGEGENGMNTRAELAAGTWKSCGDIDLGSMRKILSCNSARKGLAKPGSSALMEEGKKAMDDGESSEKSGNGEKWSRIQEQLKAQLGRDVFNSWFGRLKLCQVEGGVVLLSVPTNFLRRWLLSHYKEKILELWQAEASEVLRIDIVIRKPVALPSAETPEQNSGSSVTKSKVDKAAKGGVSAQPFEKGETPRRHEAVAGFAGSPLDPRHTFETFEEGTSNRMVHAAAMTIADEITAQHFNPLFIHAGVGLGKTHLLQAIAWRTRRRKPKVKVLYLTAEYFMWRFATAIRDKTALTLKESLRDIDILLIDDMQFLQGKAIQAEFCHLLNELIDSARQVVVAADRPPAKLESLDARVRSRLQGGVTLEIKSPDYELRKKILYTRYNEAKAEQPDLDIPEDILHYVARKVSSSGRDIEGAFNQLLVHHQFSDNGVSMEDIDRILDHLVRTTESKRIKIEDIQKIVARQFNVSRNDILSNRRTRNIVRPRQIAMYLAKSMTPRSLPEIGRRFGGRDHTTVLHAVRKIESLIADDEKLSHEIELLKRLILE